MTRNEAKSFQAEAGKAQATTRRNFLRGASIGAATAGLLAAAPRFVATREDRATSSQQPSTAATSQAAAAPSEPVVAYVRDFAKGEVSIFVGTREIIRRDPELVARLIHATA